MLFDPKLFRYLRRYQSCRTRARKLDLLARILTRYGANPAVPCALATRLAEVCERLALRAARQPYTLGEVAGKLHSNIKPIPPRTPVQFRRTLHDEVLRLLESLPRKDRLILTLHFGVNGEERLPEYKIAERVGCHRNTVRNRISAALDILSYRCTLTPEALEPSLTP